MKLGASFVEQICSMSQVIAEDNLPDYLEELRNTREDSFLEDLDDLNLSVRLKTLLSNSVAYTVLTRCGYDADRYFDETDFEFIHDFSTYETVSVWETPPTLSQNGAAGNRAHHQPAGAHFKNLPNSKTLCMIEPQRNNPERNERRMNAMTRELTYTQIGDYLYPDLYLPETEEDTPMGKYGMLHKDVPEGEQADAVRPAAAGGQAGRTSDGHRPASQRDGGAADQGVGAAERSDRGTEGHRSDGVGTGHEQLQGIGGGSGTPAADLQLNQPEQVSYPIHRSGECITPSSLFFVGQQAVDQFLRYGGNTDQLRMRVALLYQKDLPPDEIADHLQVLYHGGNGITTEEGQMSAWFGEDGIHLAHGERARYEATAQVIPWERAVERIGELLEAGQFASNVELLETESYERHLLSESLIYLYRDIDHSAGRPDPLPSLNRDHQTPGFPERQGESVRPAGKS